MGRVAGKVAIVTGAAAPNGLGFATARRLAEEGAAVILTDLDGPRVTASAATIADDGDARRAIGMAHDVAVAEDWARVVAATLDAFGRIDILVNNAGIVLKGLIADMPVDIFRKQLDVNLTGTFLGIQAVMPAMRAGGRGGSIINISSIAGLIGYAGLPGYNASKGGVRLLTKSAAMEGAEAGIRCNSVHPGKIVTDMTRPSREALGEAVVDDVPMRRLGEPVDIANCVLFLASEEAGFVTGAELVADGGATAQ